MILIKDNEIFTIKGGTSSSSACATDEGEGTNALLCSLIKRRKEAWDKKSDITLDRSICKENADIILDTPQLRGIILAEPYLLIEACFSIVDKGKRDVPFFLNAVQRDFITKLRANGSSRPYFILKGRQQGFTTLITAIQLSFAIVRRNFSGFTIADRDDNVRTIFLDKAKLMYSRLPKRLKPSERLNSSNELYFDRLNSSWRIAVASENVGRSRTLSFIHYSEASFFKCSLASLQRSVEQSLTSDAICIYETTANGYGDVKDLWDSGSCINLFYGWWLTDEYESDTPPEKMADSFIRERARMLSSMNISERKISWYIKKYQSYIDRASIKQEYPCFPEEAFIASSDSIFNKDSIYALLSGKEVPYIRGCFVYKKKSVPVYSENGEVILFSRQITDICFERREDGYIKIVEEPYIRVHKAKIEKKPYVIGADTSGTGEDYYAAKVIDNISGRCVATLHIRKMDEDLFSEQLYCLGRYYNDAVIAVETNYSRHPVRVLRSLGYENIYSSSGEPYCGFLTTSVTRPLMIARLVEVMRESAELETDRETLCEMLDFVKHPSGKAQAVSGRHDDLVISSAIARYVAESCDNTMKVVTRYRDLVAELFSPEADGNNTYLEW